MNYDASTLLKYKTGLFAMVKQQLILNSALYQQNCDCYHHHV